MVLLFLFTGGDVRSMQNRSRFSPRYEFHPSAPSAPQKWLLGSSAVMSHDLSSEGALNKMASSAAGLKWVSSGRVDIRALVLNKMSQKKEIEKEGRDIVREDLPLALETATDRPGTCLCSSPSSVS